MIKGRAIPEGAVGSSSGCSLCSKPLPCSRELRWGASAQRKSESASHRQDFICAVSSLFLPCRKQWPQQQTGSCGQSRQWIGAAVPGREQELLELQQGEAPHRSYERALGCREGKILPGRRGVKAELAPSESHRPPRVLGKAMPAWARPTEHPEAIGTTPTSRTFTVGDITAC